MTLFPTKITETFFWENYSISGRNVRIDRNTKISANTYIGKYSTIGLSTSMGESVIIYGNVKLPNAAKIKSNEIIIKTPTSFELYAMCERHVTDNE